MDANLFYFLNLVIYALMLLALSRVLPNGPNILVPFIAALFGFVVFSAVNSDGSLISGYPQFVGDTTHTSPVWPSLYLTLFGIVSNLATAAYNGFR